MIEFKHRAALFDLDGVILNTEPQYTVFWNRLLADYYPDPVKRTESIKGTTLFQTFDMLFSGNLEKERPVVLKRLREFERSMPYPYVPGFEDFVTSLREKGVKTAVVTSSNTSKMENVYRAHPEFKDYFDAILMAEDFTESKPSPQCYLLAAERLGMKTGDCAVFEDSINGLKSGRAAKMYTVGLTTEHPAEEIKDLSDIQIPDFR